MKISKALHKYFSLYQIVQEENVFSRLEDGKLKYYKYSRKICQIEICLLGEDFWQLPDISTKYFILLSSLAEIPACLLMQELKKDVAEHPADSSLLDMVLSHIALPE